MVKIGCCGFPLSKQQYFKYFKLVELQNTFYKLPAKLSTVERWKTEVPKDFEFTLKCWQTVTHPASSPTYRRSGLRISPEEAQRYGFFRLTEQVKEGWKLSKQVAECLGARIMVVQCPPSFECKEENVQQLRQFFTKIDRKGVEIALELRGNWLEEPSIVKRVVNELKLIHCVDPFWDEPQSKHSIAYFRLHGRQRRYNYSYVYSKTDLEELVEKVLKLERKGKEVYVLFNNVGMHQNARQFIHLLAG